MTQPLARPDGVRLGGRTIHAGDDAGKAHVVALSNIQYPTQVPAKKSSYAYGLGERQLEWLRQDIASVPKDRAIVIASHAPLHEFYYSSSYTHAQINDIYEILKGRQVISLAGHTTCQRTSVRAT